MYVYFDNSILRRLMDSSEKLDKFIEWFEAELNLSWKNCKPITSHYLFLEYIGFTKKSLNIPKEFLQCDFQNTKISIKSLKDGDVEKVDDVRIIDKKIEEIFKKLVVYIKGELLKKRKNLENLIEERSKFTNLSQRSSDLNNMLFVEILDKIQNDYQEFVEIMAEFLAWDEFCNIEAQGLPIGLLRQRQLGYWVYYWEQNVFLPSAKIIDDMAKYYEMRFDASLKNYEDMVDAEIFTYFVTGYRNENNEIMPVSIFTCDDPVSIKQRACLAGGCIVNIEKTLKRAIKCKPGEIHCFDCLGLTYKETIKINMN
jgi:hypothetical protein